MNTEPHEMYYSTFNYIQESLTTLADSVLWVFFFWLSKATTVCVSLLKTTTGSQVMTHEKFNKYATQDTFLIQNPLILKCTNVPYPFGSLISALCH